MNSLRTLTLAAALALIGMAGGYAGGALAQTGNLAAQQGHDAVLIGLLLPAVQKAPEGDDAADLATGEGGGQAHGVAKVGPGALTLGNQNTYAGRTAVNQGVLNQKGSLQRLGSIGDLFASSRGGDQAASAQGAGGVVQTQEFRKVAKAGDGSVMPAEQLTGEGGAKPIALLLPAVQKVRESAARSPAGGAGQPVVGQIAGGGAPKELNLSNSARK